MSHGTSYYESLLRDFERQPNDSIDAQEGALVQQQDAYSIASGGRTQTGAVGSSLGASEASGGGMDFFASFSGQQSIAVPERVEAPASVGALDSGPQQGRGLRSRVRDLLDSRSRHRTARGTASALRVIPWLFFSNGAVARFLRTVLIVAVLAAVLWSARYAIGDAIIGLVSTLGPLALVAYCIYRIIR